MTTKDLYKLQNSWTARVQLKNGLEETIWYTALPSMEHIINKVISVSSDYPRYKKLKK